MGNLHIGAWSKLLFRRTLQGPSATASFFVCETYLKEVVMASVEEVNVYVLL